MERERETTEISLHLQPVHFSAVTDWITSSRASVPSADQSTRGGRAARRTHTTYQLGGITRSVCVCLIKLHIKPPLRRANTPEHWQSNRSSGGEADKLIETPKGDNRERVIDQLDDVIGRYWPYHKYSGICDVTDIMQINMLGVINHYLIKFSVSALWW